MAKFLAYYYKLTVAWIVRKKKKGFLFSCLFLSLSPGLFFFFFFYFSQSRSLCSSSPSISMLFVSLFLTAAVCLAGATASLTLFKIALAHPARLPHRLFKIALPEPSHALSHGYEWVVFVKSNMGCGWVLAALSGFVVVGMG